MTSERRIMGDHVANQEPAAKGAGDSRHNEYRNERNQAKLFHRGERPESTPAHQIDPVPAESQSKPVGLSTKGPTLLCTSEDGSRPLVHDRRRPLVAGFDLSRASIIHVGGRRAVSHCGAT